MSAPNVNVEPVAVDCISHGEELAIAAERPYRISMGWLATMAQAYFPAEMGDSRRSLIQRKASLKSADP
jgi:hypothetical protein